MEENGPVARLILNRPDKKNAANAAMWREIPVLLERAASNPAIRALIVCGAGDSFAAGADISEMGELIGKPAQAAEYAETFSNAMEAVAAFPHPTLALIRGACIGGGCGLALACDRRIADDTARLGITAARLGLLYTVADTQRLIDAVGMSEAKNMLFTAAVYDAEKAEKIGLVDQMAAPDALEDAAQAWIAKITPLSPYTLTGMKCFIRQAGDSGETETTRRAFAEAFSGPQFAEGFSAFTERRAPEFPEDY